MTKNKYGLSRAIPSIIKEEVRRKCRFGCVLCGSIPIEYDHFDPPFSEAKVHSSDGIVALCPTCHRQRGAGVVSIADIRNAIKNPACLTSRFASNKLFVPFSNFEWNLPGIEFRDNEKNIFVNNEFEPFKISSGREDGEPVLFSAFFADENWDPICVIESNELKFLSQSVGDIVSIANRIEVKSRSGGSILNFSIEGADRLMNFENLRYFYNGVYIEARAGQFLCGVGERIHLFEGAVIKGCSVAIELIGRGGPPLKDRRIVSRGSLRMESQGGGGLLCR